MRRVLCIAALISVSACSPQSWTCDDPQVISAVRGLLSERVADQTKIAAGLVSISTNDVNTEAVARAVATTLADPTRTTISDPIDRSFDKAIGKRACSATIKYKLPDAAIPTLSLYERTAATEAVTGSFEYDKKTGVISAPLLYLSQPTSDGKKMATTVESAAGLITGAFMLESMWAAAQAQVERQADLAKKKAAVAEIVATFRTDCTADVKTKAIRLGGMNESESLEHANKVCGEAAEKFSDCAIAGGKVDSCSKLAYSSTE